ncbi:hypothetical protein QAD02_001374 [Eretmocerus hayati]|uniref:Uncharacterized protein n=1 Tax=Eretmocerus hayati TaxID=131215 RepID=A0ACC2NG33_9HYME|nr:hypothetical protein QAD02_001374 [Eretmocerus hayati]
MHVITAASCVTGKRTDEIRIFAGSNTLSLCDKYDVDTWLIHNDWAYKNGQPTLFSFMDIAIIRLTKKVDERKVRPALISPKLLKHFYGLDGTLAGWSGTDDETRTKIMQTSMTKILTKDECYFEVPNQYMRSAIRNQEILCSESNQYFSHGYEGGPILYGTNIFIGVNLQKSPGVTDTKYKRLNFYTGLENHRKFFYYATAGAQFSVA